MTTSDTSPPPLRIALDVTALLGPLTGVGVFVRELAAGLARDEAVDLRTFAVSWRGRGGLRAATPPGARPVSRPMPARLARAAWRRGDHPTARLLAGRADLVHGPNFVVPPGGGAAELVTVHDLTAVHYPQMCTPDVLEWPDLLRRALRRGAWVHTVSDFVADEVRDAFGVDPGRVLVVPNGTTPPGPDTEGRDGMTGRTLVGGDRYVLALGTVDPRKDLTSLVAAFDLLAPEDPDLHLAVAGADGLGTPALEAAIAASPHAHRIARIAEVDDDRRVALLRGASAVAYPSRYEGFGLVPLEAMAVGTPVVATAAGAVPEVAGDAAVLVAPEDPAALAEGLEVALYDGPRGAELIARGHERVAHYSWADTAAGMVSAYRRILSD